MKAQTAGSVFNVTRIKLEAGGRLLLRVGGKQVAELDVPPESSLVVLRKVLLTTQRKEQG